MQDAVIGKFVHHIMTIIFLFILWLLSPVGLGYADSAPPFITDDDIVIAIEERLAQDDRIQENLINVATEDGIVTLSGEADNLLAKERAADLAGTIKGVRSVVNHIFVNPWLGQNDQKIEHQVKSSLLDNSATELYDMRVQATKGVVTLTGVVQSWSEKQLALSVAKGIKGVRDVHDHLRIETIPDRSDEAMREEIIERLKHDVWVASENIAVEVNNGMATLSGTVRSVEQRSRAELLSWVHGITAVNGPDLKVAWSPGTSMHRSGFHIPPDKQIRQAVSDALSVDPRISHEDITVDVKDGLVTLSGTAGHLQANQFAEEDARQTTGVYHVVNHMKGRTDPNLSDEAIARRVRGILLRDPFLDQSDIAVTVHQHTIYLRGTVKSRIQKQRAATLASTVPGAVQVSNHLQYPRKWVTRSDLELYQHIQEQLWWSPFLSDHTITIQVEHGVATLNGTVGTWQQRLRAEEHAVAAGAKKVHNQLRLPPRIKTPSISG